MSEEKEKKGLDVYFPEEDCSKEEKKLAVNVLDFYINEQTK